MVDRLFCEPPDVDAYQTVLAEQICHDSDQKCHHMRSAISKMTFEYHGELPNSTVVLITNAHVCQTKPIVILQQATLTEVFARPTISKQHVLDVIELCAGIGCLGEGLEHAGFRIALRCDVNTLMSQLSAQRYAGEVLTADITTDDFMPKMLAKCPSAGTLAAGVACQPYSKLGDRRMEQDSRSMTFPKTLEAGFFSRCLIIIIECVTEAQTCTWIQRTLNMFMSKTGYRSQQTLLHLQHLWPARRSRWWCVLVHPLLQVPSIPDPPKVQPAPMILHLLDHFKICDDDELRELQLDLYDLRNFSDYGMGTNQIPLAGQMPTSLHSCGNQLGSCPCGCRTNGFTISRLEKGGLHGLLIPLQGYQVNGNNVYQNHRHIHSDELTLFNGAKPGQPHRLQQKLALCAYGQLASPLQSLWVGSHVLQSLVQDGVLQQLAHATPLECLSKFMQKLLTARDDVFGPQTGPPALQFATMVQNHTFAMPPLPEPVTETPIAAVTAPEAPEALGQTEPIVESRPADSTGGVSGFEGNKRRRTEPQSTEAMSAPTAMTAPAPEVPELSDAALLAALPPEVAPVDATGAVTVTDQTNHVWVYQVDNEQPVQVRIQPEATVGSLLRAELTVQKNQGLLTMTTLMGTQLDAQAKLTKDQRIALNSPPFTPPRCPHTNTCADHFQIDFPCTRHVALHCQKAWVATDEFDYYLSSIADTSDVITWPSQVLHDAQLTDDTLPTLVDDHMNMLGDQDMIATAFVVHQHWIPVVSQRNGQVIHVHSTPEGKPIVDQLTAQFARHNMQVQHVAKPLQHVFAGDCGFQAFAWLVATTNGTSHSPLTEAKAEGWRELFRKYLIEHEGAEVVIESLDVGGMLTDKMVTQQLTQLLLHHGVWESRVDERAKQVIQQLGSQAVRGIVMSTRNKWADLKSAANQLRPPLRLIMPDELEEQIASRTNQKKAIGKKPKQSTQSKPVEMKIHADDLTIPAGVFKQADGLGVGTVSKASLGPGSRGVLILDQQDADAVLRLPRPVTQHGLCLLVLATPQNRELHESEPIRFPAMCKATQEPLLALAFSYQLGQVTVERNEPAQKLAVQEQSADAIRCLVYKDQVGSMWDDLVKQPVKTVFKVESDLFSPGESSSPVIDVWDRQWLTKRFEKCKAEHAEVFSFSLRVLTPNVDRIVSSSGNQGIYYEPRSQCGRYPNASYHVTWLPHMNYQDAKLAQQTSPQVTTLVRHGERYGLRCDALNAKEIHEKYRPHTPLLLGQDKRTYILGPLPFSTTKEGVAKLLKQWQWDAKPLQPKGRSRDSSGIDWTIQGVEDPAFWIYSLQHGDVLISRTHQDKPEPPAAMSIVASRRTLQHLQKQGPDPWLEQDPWQTDSKSTSASSQVSSASATQLHRLEATIDKKIADALQTVKARDDDDPMEGDGQMSQRVSHLEQQIQQLTANQQTCDNKLNQLHAQVELQTKSFGATLDTKLADQMDKIEALMLSRRSTLLGIIAFVTSMRIGEANNPGPIFGSFNATGLMSKSGVIKTMPSGTYAVQETHLSSRGIPRFKQELRWSDSGYHMCHGHPAPLQSDTPSAIGGRCTGVATLSTCPTRVLGHDWTSQEFQTSRCLVTATLVQQHWVTVGNGYGYADRHNTVDTQTKTNALLAKLTSRVVDGCAGFRMVVGDWNQERSNVTQADYWESRGWQEAQKFMLHKFGRPVQATCKHSTVKDFVYLSPEMLPLVDDVVIDWSVVPDHAVIRVHLRDFASPQPLPFWYKPQPIQWPAKWEEQTLPPVASDQPPDQCYQSIMKQLETQAKHAMTQQGQVLSPTQTGRATVFEVHWSTKAVAPPKPPRRGDFQSELTNVTLQHSRWTRQELSEYVLEMLCQGSKSTQGPCNSFLRAIHKLGWQWMGSGLCRDHRGQSFWLLQCCKRELITRIHEAWQFRILDEVSRIRPTMHDITQADVPATMASVRTFPPEQQAALRCALNGTQFTNDVLVHTGKVSTSMCKFCSEADSACHRHWECPFFQDIRDRFPLVCAKRPDLPSCSQTHGWIPTHPSFAELRRQLTQLPDSTGDLVLPPVSSFPTPTLDLFLDGGCTEPSQPYLRVATWGVVMWHDDKFWTVGRGGVPGFHQTSLRGEITAAISALKTVVVLAKPARLWIDNNDVYKVLNAWQQGEDFHQEKRTDVDLWSYLWLQFRAAAPYLHMSVKVSSHCNPAEQEGVVDSWAVEGNQAADQAATDARSDLPAALWRVWHDVKLQLDERQRWVRDFHMMLVEIGMRAMQATQVERDIPPAGLPVMLAEPLVCDPGLLNLAGCDYAMLPQKCQTEEAEYILNWLQAMMHSEEPVIWVSFHQLLLLYQRHSNRTGPRPQRKCRGVTWGANSVGDDYVHKTQVQWFSQFLLGACRTLQVPMEVEQRRSPSHLLSFWSGCVRGRVSNHSLSALDDHLRSHVQCQPVRLVKHLDRVSPFWT
eukprot:Skav221152  [mRNA]  locus=scaffold2925:187181:196674:+ [translate_table: standard]